MKSFKSVLPLTLFYTANNNNNDNISRTERAVETTL